MINYIIKALLNDNSIFINDLGTFTKQYQSARFEGDTMLPPQYIVNLIVKDDQPDGTEFINLLCREKQCRITEAAAEISRWVEELKTALENNKSVSFDNFGTFSLSDKGVIQFVCDHIDEINREFEGMGVVKLGEVGIGSEMEEERIRGEEEQRMREEEERLAREAEEKRLQEEAEQRLREAEEQERLAKEAEERRLQEEAEQRLREEEEQRMREEEERRTREAEEKRLQEEAEQRLREAEEQERLAKEAEERRLQEEAEQRLREEEERRVREAEEKRLQEEAEQRLREAEEQERLAKEAEDRRLQEEAEQRLREEEEQRMREEEVKEVNEVKEVDEDSDTDGDDGEDNIPTDGKNKHRSLWWLFVLLILIALGVLGYLFRQQLLTVFNNLKEKITAPKEAVVTEEPETVAEDTIAYDETVAEDTVSEPEVYTPEVVRNTANGNYPVIRFEQGHYYVIAGSLPSEQDAVRHIKQRNLDQYEPKLVTQSGVSNLRVCIGIFDTEEEAESFAKNVNPKYWVLK